MRTRIALIALLVVAGCTKSNPDYCESSSDCTDDPARPFCDVDGSFEGEANACIPTPDDAPDAAPPPIDAACIPTTCEAGGKNCGEIDNGCGSPLDCGVCVVPLSCGGGAEDNVCGGSCVSASWTSEEILAADATGSTSIAVGPSGGIHVAAAMSFGGGDVQVTYAHRTLGSWLDEPIDSSSVGTNFLGVSLDVDSEDAVHVTYIKGFAYSPQYAYLFPGSGWQLQELSSEFAEKTSLAVDLDDGIHVAMDGRYTYRSFGGTWVGETNVVAGSDPSIAVDPSGGPHIALHDRSTDQVLYGYLPGDRWVTEIVASSPGLGYGRSLAVDASGAAHVAYPDFKLDYGYRTGGGSWSTETVDSATGVGPESSVAVLGDTVHIVYADTVNDDLKYAVGRPGGPWTIQRVDTSSVDSRETSITVDGAGGVHVTYSNESGSLRYAYRCP